MALPGSAAIPAPYKERLQSGYKTGVQIVDMVHVDRKPSDIMTRQAFENAIVVNTAIGGSTNAPIHLIAVAKHMGIELDLNDWDNLGFHVPLLLNVQPAGEFLCEEYFRAGGLPAIIAELLHAKALPHPEAVTATGKSLAHYAQEAGQSWDRRVILPFDKPMKSDAGFLHITGNLFDSAIMKTSVISEEFRTNFLSDPNDPEAFECKAVVFDGPEDYNTRLEDPKTGVDARTILVMRGAGPLGYPGAAEVVNMHPPGRLIQQGVTSLPCIGDGRQSGTSGSPSILNASPEAAAGGNLAILKDGDIIRVDLRKRTVNMLIDEAELQNRKKQLQKAGGYKYPKSQTPWEEIFRNEVGQLSGGMVIERAVKYQRVVQNCPAPRDNH